MENEEVPTTSTSIRKRCSKAARIASRRKHNSQFRESERCEDAVRRAVARSQPGVRDREQVTNTVQRRQTRSNTRVCAAEQAANTARRSIARSDSQVRETEQAANTAQRRVTRAMSATRAAEQVANTAQHRDARAHSPVRESQQAANTAQRRVTRAMSATRAAEQVANTAQHRDARAHSPVREAEQAANSQRRRTVRQLSEVREHEHSVTVERRTRNRTDWDIVVGNYKEAVKDGPFHRCHCCNRLFFKRSMHRISQDTLETRHTNDFLQLIVTTEVNAENLHQFCGSCRNNIRLLKVPRYATSNGLIFPTIPPELSDLSQLEERCVAARIPFMQIRPLGVDRQLGLKGSVVNVPLDVDHTVNMLPRNYNETHTIQLQWKRRMEFAHNYMFETVRPIRIFEAARYLVAQPLYQTNGINIDLTWMDSHADEGEENFVVNPADEVLRRAEILVRENEDSDSNVAEDESHAQIQETLLDQNNILAIAPAEDRRPVPLAYDKEAEELAFPTIYCGKTRETTANVTYNVIVNSEIRRYDRRAARADHLLYAYKKLQIQTINANITIALRQGSFGDSAAPTVEDILNPEEINNIISHDSGYKMLGNIPSSPAYWEGQKRNLCATIRQLGIPTMFITVSAAEAKWNELLKILKKTVDKTEPSDEEIAAMTTREKYRLISSDPVTCALYFDHRFKELVRTWKCPNGPFGIHTVSFSSFSQI
jgi:Helitron helicase-like domain at N-terminus